MGKRTPVALLLLTLVLAPSPPRRAWARQGAAPATGAQGAPPAVEVASYTLHADLDVDLHRLRGRGRLRWRNTTAHPAPDLCLHLYLNGFSNSASTWLRHQPDLAERLAGGGWGWIELQALEGADGDDLLAGLAYVAPDDGNRQDRSVARVPLPRPVPPGGELEVDLEFVAQLPRLVARSGFKNDFHLVAQWFPKLAVREPDGTWSCRQFHRSSEFYADFGTYDVTLVVPRGFVVGATGGEPVTVDEGPDTTAYRFVQERVHDFAWTAWPGFVERRRRFRHRGLPEVEIRLLTPRGALHHSARTFAALERGLRDFGTWYGAYPYPTLTVVHPPWGAEDAGGMEYPTFITTGGRVLAPAASQRPEEVTVHELAHQWFYGLLASDELTEPYLDEGVTTYATSRLLGRAYGPEAWAPRLWEVPLVVPGLLREHPLDTSARYFEDPTLDPITRTSWGYLDRNAFGRFAYQKMALLLEQIERTVGEPAMEQAMRAYAARYRFRHPRTRDLARTLARHTGHDLEPLFRQALVGSAVLDYAVTEASSTPRTGTWGMVGAGEERREVASPPERSGFASEVVVRRLGDVALPVTVELTFADDRTLRLTWEGDERWVRYRLRGPRLLTAEVDPDEILVLDVDRLNNSRRTAPDRRAARRWGQTLRFWIQNALESFASLA